MIRVGFFGTRGHTLKFIGLVNGIEGSRACAIWSDDPEKAKKTAAESGVDFCGTPEEVLEKCDAVVITVPNAYKKELVIKAAQAGKHIFLEKPIAVTERDALEMAEAVRNAGVKFYMSDPFVRNGTIALKDMIAEGMLGEITAADVRIAVDRAVVPGHPPVWNRQTALGGILADIGGHGIHIVHYLFGMPDKVYAECEMFTEDARKAGMEDQVQLVLHYPDRRIVTVSASWISGGESEHTLVYGTKGWASVEKEADEKEVQKVVLHLKEGVQVFDAARLSLRPTRHIRYFIEMIEKDLDNSVIGTDPYSNFGVGIDQAAEYARLIEAAYRSAAEGRSVRL